MYLNLSLYNKQMKRWKITFFRISVRFSIGRRKIGLDIRNPVLCTDLDILSILETELADSCWSDSDLDRHLQTTGIRKYMLYELTFFTYSNVLYAKLFYT
jgi:hypothetical protein